MATRFPLGSALALLLIALASGACSEKRDDPVYSFSYGHISSDAPAVDILIDGNLAFEDLAPGDVTGYIEYPWRPRDFTMLEVGTGRVVIPPTPPAPIPSRGEQTVLLVGKEADDSLGLLRFNQARGVPKRGKMRFVLGNGSPDLSRIGFLLNSNRSSRNVRYLRGSNPLRVPAGKVRIRVESDDPQYRLFDLAYDLEEGDYSVILEGRAEEGTLTMGVLEDAVGVFEEPIAKLRFLHFLPGTDRLDFLVDGNLLERRLPYAKRREYFPLGPLPHQVTANLADTDMELVDFGVIQFERAVSLTFVAFGDEAGNPVGIQFPDDQPPGDPDVARIRFLHVAPVGGAVDVFGDDVLLFEGVPFGSVTEYVGTDRGNLKIRVALSGSGEPLLDERNFSFRGGADFTLALDGIPDGDPPLKISRIDDDKS